ncbi:MAG: hypothetical protein H0V89_12500 [Deltaproteobacteria bacterium]|nr:hypothetical protein [Deltaproteobacteria bacterium]
MRVLILACAFGGLTLAGCGTEKDGDCNTSCTEIFDDCDAGCDEDDDCALTCAGDRDICITACDEGADDEAL